MDNTSPSPFSPKMKLRTQAILTAFTTVYLLTIAFTDLSLVGYWTDILSSILLVSIGLWATSGFKAEKTWLKYILRVLNVSYALVVFGIVGLNLINPFAWDSLKMRSFYYEKVDGRLFNAYFKPVGANSGGEGNFWITETPKYFPIIEMEKFYEGAVLWDFRATEWEGEVIDQNVVVKRYIQKEVIDQESKN